MLRQARAVDFQTKFNLLRLRPTPALLAIILTLFPLVFAPLFAIVVSKVGDNLPDIDYDMINEHGISTQATIIDIETQQNITINHEHPSVITYKYYIESVNAHTVEAQDHFQTLSPREVDRLTPGDEIEIKYLDGQSSIPSLEPFSFPYWIFYGAFYVSFAIVLVAGIVFTVITIRYLRKHIYLYKYGTVQEGKFISATQPATNHSKTLRVDYQYTTSYGQSVIGESRSTDYSLLRESNYGDPIKIFVSPDNEQQSCVILRQDAVRNNWQI